MNESVQTDLMILVERAVRPVRASAHRKHSMRVELLAHVNDVFAEEAATASDSRAALERTAHRFGTVRDITHELQESVPAFDRVLRFLEGRPGESTLRSTLRFAWIETAVAWGALAISFLAAQGMLAWSQAELFSVLGSLGFLPFWVFGPLWFAGTALVAHWGEPWLQDSTPLQGRPHWSVINWLTSAWAAPALRFALLVGGVSVLGLIYVGGFTWPMQRVEWNVSKAIGAALFTGAMMASSVALAWVLVQIVHTRRRRYLEWASLPLHTSEA